MKTVELDYEKYFDVHPIKFNPWVEEHPEVTRFRVRVKGLPRNVSQIRFDAAYFHDDKGDKINLEKHIRLGFILPVSDTPTGVAEKVVEETSLLKLGGANALLDIVGWTEGYEASISIGIKEAIDEYLDVILEVSWSDDHEASKWIYSEETSPKICITVTPKSKNQQLDAKQFIIPFKTYNTVTDSRKDFIEMAMDLDVYNPKGIGYSLHQKQVLTSMVMNALIEEKYPMERDLVVNYIGTDTWENLFSTVRNLIHTGVWDSISKFVIWYEESWDKQIMDRYNFSGKLGNYQKISIRSRGELDEIQGEIEPGDITICTYVAPWAIKAPDISQAQVNEYQKYLLGTLVEGGTLIVVDPKRDSYVRSRPVPTNFNINWELTEIHGWKADSDLKRKLKKIPEFESCKYDLFTTHPDKKVSEKDNWQKDKEEMQKLLDKKKRGEGGLSEPQLAQINSIQHILDSDHVDGTPEPAQRISWLDKYANEESAGTTTKELHEGGLTWRKIMSRASSAAKEKGEEEDEKTREKISLWGIQKRYSSAMASLLFYTRCAGRLAQVNELFHPDLYFLDPDRHKGWVESGGTIPKDFGEKCKKEGNPLDPSAHEDGVYILTGSAGTGKSTAFRNLSRVVLEARPDSEEIEWVEEQSTLPIFLTAKSIESYIDFASIGIDLYARENFQMPYSELWIRTLATVSRAYQSQKNNDADEFSGKEWETLMKSFGVSLEALYTQKFGPREKKWKMNLIDQKYFEISMHSKRPIINYGEDFHPDDLFHCFVDREKDEFHLELLSCAIASSALDTYGELQKTVTHSELVDLISHGLKEKKISLFVDALDEAKDPDKVIQFLDKLVFDKCITYKSEVDYFTPIREFTDSLDGEEFKRSPLGTTVSRKIDVARVYLSTRPEILPNLTERMRKRSSFCDLTYTEDELRTKLPTGLLRGWGVESRDSLSKLTVAKLELPSVFRNPWEIGHALSMIDSGTFSPDSNLDVSNQSDWEFMTSVVKLWMGVYPHITSAYYLFDSVRWFLQIGQFQYNSLTKKMISRMTNSAKRNATNPRTHRYFPINEIEKVSTQQYNSKDIQRIIKRYITTWSRYFSHERSGDYRKFNNKDRKEAPYKMIPANVLMEIISNPKFKEKCEDIQPPGITSSRDEKVAKFYSRILEFNIDNSLRRKGNLAGLNETKQQELIQEVMAIISLLSYDNFARWGIKQKDRIKLLWEMTIGVSSRGHHEEGRKNVAKNIFPILESMGFEKFYRIITEDFSSLFTHRKKKSEGFKDSWWFEWEHEKLKALAAVKLIHESDGVYPGLRKILVETKKWNAVLGHFTRRASIDRIKTGFSLYGEGDMVTYLNSIYQICTEPIDPHFFTPLEPVLYNLAEDNNLSEKIVENWKRYWFESYMAGKEDTQQYPPIPIPVRLVGDSIMGSKALHLLKRVNEEIYKRYPFLDPHVYNLNTIHVQNRIQYGSNRLAEAMTIWQSNKDLQVELFSYLEETVCKDAMYELFFQATIMSCISFGEDIRYSSWAEGTKQQSKVLSSDAIQGYDETQTLSVLRELEALGYGLSVFGSNSHEISNESLQLAREITNIDLPTPFKNNPEAAMAYRLGAVYFRSDMVDHELQNHIFLPEEILSLSILNLKRSFLSELGARILLFNPFKDYYNYSENKRTRMYSHDEVLRRIAIFDQLMRLISQCMDPTNTGNNIPVIRPNQIAWDKTSIMDSKVIDHHLPGNSDNWDFNTVSGDQDAEDKAESNIYHLDRISVSRITKGEVGKHSILTVLKDKPYKHLIGICDNLGIETEGCKTEEIITKIHEHLAPEVKRRSDEITPAITDRWSDILSNFIDIEKLNLTLSRDGIVGILYGDSLVYPGRALSSDPILMLFKSVIEAHKNTLNRLFGDLETYYRPTRHAITDYMESLNFQQGPELS